MSKPTDPANLTDPMQEPIELASETYFRRVMELAKEWIPAAKWEEIVRKARAWTGGKSSPKANDDEEDPEIIAAQLRLEQSFGDIERQLYNLIEERFPTSQFPYPEKRAWIAEIFTDSVVIEYDAKYWRIGYSIEDAEVVLADEWVEVRKGWLEAQRAERPHLTLKRVGDWFVAPAHNLPLADENAAWSWDAAASNAILDQGGWALYKQAHLVVNVSESDTPERKSDYKYPVAKIMDGQLKYVFRAAATVYAGLRGGARKADLPRNVEEAVFQTVKGIYKKFDRDTSDMSLQVPSFAQALAIAADAGRPHLLMLVGIETVSQEGLVVNSKGWIKKAILTTGQWVEPPPGGSEPLTLTKVHLDSIQEAFTEKVFPYVTIPIGHPAVEFADENTGFVRALEQEPHPTDEGEWILYAWMEFTEPEIAEKVRRGTVADTSVYVVPNVTRPRDGKVFPLALKHVALTNDPWMQDLGAFKEQALAASYRPLVQQRIMTEVRNMADKRTQEPTERPMVEVPQERHELLLKFEQEGVDITEALALVRKRKELDQREQKVAEREEQAFRMARENTVKDIVAALEGRSTREGVTLVQGRRHYPVVVRAVEEILQAVPATGLTLQLILNGSKKPEDISLDEVVLRLVNALPEGARMELKEPPAAPQPGEGRKTGPAQEGEWKEEDLEAFARAMNR